MDILIQYAMTFVGKPYIWGGDDPIMGLDCSGLVQELLASAGIDPIGDQTAQGLFNAFEHNGRWNACQAGALAFYGQSVTKITHVAMLLDPYRVIEAGGGGQSCVDSKSAAEKNAFIRIRLLKHRADLVAVIRPDYSTVGVV